MIVEAEGFNMYDAFQSVKEEIGLESYIDLAKAKEADMPLEAYENLGFCFGVQVGSYGENPNQIQTVVKNMPAGGTKKWLTVYSIVFDNDESLELASDNFHQIKKDSIDEAREITQSTGRNTYLLVGKKPDNFSRVEAEITYKPAPGQSLAKFKFIY